MATKGLIDAANKKNGKWKKWVIFAFVCLAGWFGWNILSGDKSADITEEVFYTVEREDLSIFIDGDGNIESEQVLPLFFEQSGTVKSLYVKEGDSVQKGEVLAELDAYELEFEAEKARVALETAQANLNSVLAGATREDKIIAQKNIESSRFDLEKLEQDNEQSVEKALLALQEAEKNLELAKKENENSGVSQTLDSSLAENSVATAEENLRIAQEKQEQNKKASQTSLSQSRETAKTVYLASSTVVSSALQEAKMILQPNDEEGYDLGYLFSAQDSQSKRSMETKYLILESAFTASKNSISFEFLSKEEIIETLETRKKELEQWKNFMSVLSVGIDNTVSSVDVTLSQLSSIQATLTQKESSLSAEIQKLLSAQQSLENIDTATNSQILTDENAVLQAEKTLLDAQNNQEKIGTDQSTTVLKDETAVQAAERNYERAKLDYESLITSSSIDTSLYKNRISVASAQYDNLVYSPRKSDTAVLRKQIENSQILYDQALFRLSQSQIIAPFDGIMLKIPLEEGQKASSSSLDPHMEMRAADAFVMKTNIEEAEIAKIIIGQKVVVYFDALEDVFLDGKVSHISPVADIDSNGVVTYSVTVNVDEGSESGMKEGMTAYGKFILLETTDALVIPFSSIQTEENNSFVLGKDGKKIFVKIGITNGKKIEIVSGLNEGNEILIIK